MKIDQPYHEGELQIQARVGVLDEGAQNARVIQDSIIKGALRFLNQLPMAVVGSVDQEDNVWASVLVGSPGFLGPKEDRTVQVDLTKVVKNEEDPFWNNIQKNPRVGMVAIELATRRRLRINGRMKPISEKKLELHVEESYPNCPKYIQRRHVVVVQTQNENGKTPSHPRRGRVLGPTQKTVISQGDTLFVASLHSERGVDASHRGGTPGFVSIVDEHILRIPDYPGNAMFNTFGNFTIDPRGGLAFIDFGENRTLQLTGTAKIVHDVPGSEDITGGTRRFWEFEIDQWLETDLGSQVTWEYLDASPFNPSPSNRADK